MKDRGRVVIYLQKRTPRRQLKAYNPEIVPDGVVGSNLMQSIARFPVFLFDAYLII